MKVKKLAAVAGALRRHIRGNLSGCSNNLPSIAAIKPDAIICSG